MMDGWFLMIEVHFSLQFLCIYYVEEPLDTQKPVTMFVKARIFYLPLHIHRFCADGGVHGVVCIPFVPPAKLQDHWVVHLKLPPTMATLGLFSSTDELYDLWNNVYISVNIKYYLGL